jgi:hypothetical protein
MFSRITRAIRPVRNTPRQFGGHAKEYKLRGPHNQRKKNEWDFAEEHIPPSQTDVVISKFLGATCWLWIAINIYEDKGKVWVKRNSYCYLYFVTCHAQGFYKPWLEPHHHEPEYNFAEYYPRK